jgi:hypothetical protein
MNFNPLVKLNTIFHKPRPHGKSYLPNPAPALRLVFKKDVVGTLKKVKGWGTDREMAEALGVTRAYVSMMAARRVSVSHNIILRLAWLLGSTRGNWWVLYEIIEAGEPVDHNHPLWNEDKYQGRMPYARFSSSAQLREPDYPVEKRTYMQEFSSSSKTRKKAVKLSK